MSASIHRMLFADSISEPSVRAFAEALDDIDAIGLLYAMFEVYTGRTDLCKERNRIPLKDGRDLVLYKIIQPEAQMEIAVLEKSPEARASEKLWPNVVDFTLPVRFNYPSMVAYSTREDMPIYTAFRAAIRADLQFVHVEGGQKAFR